MPEPVRSLRVRCERANLGPIRHFVQEWLDGFELPERLAGQLLVAVDEVCANIIVHGNHEDPSTWITVRLRQCAGILEFEMLDRGQPFEPPPFAPPDLKRHIEERRKGGLGLTLVHLIMDRVEFSTTPDGVNVCRLYKALP
jgi:serine/threonine-protein kinase RsbW